VAIPVFLSPEKDMSERAASSVSAMKQKRKKRQLPVTLQGFDVRAASGVERVTFGIRHIFRTRMLSGGKNCPDKNLYIVNKFICHKVFLNSGIPARDNSRRAATGVSPSSHVIFSRIRLPRVVCAIQEM
jgi:hypothetical protein